jgi:Domain of unknown function (DUF4124)
MQKLSLIFLFSLLAMSNIAAADGKKIVKWVDSKGVTQYGDKMPASEAGRNNAEMNTQGMVVKKNVAADKSNEAIDQQKLEQDRKDKILLASYTNAEEIDLARERNLQMDKAGIQALTQQKVNVTSRTARNNKAADGFKARKKPVPAYLSDELKLSKLEIASIDKQLAQRKLSMEATRTRYSEEKARFVELKQTTTIAGSPQDIKALTAKLNELNNWKQDVERRINVNQQELLQRKRRGESTESPTYKYSENTLVALQAESQRAEEDIAATKNALAEKKAIVSAKGT